MLKHCRPDILARGHLSLLHRDTTPTRTPEWGQSVSVLAQEGGPAERPLRRTEAQTGTDVRDSMVRTGPAATASVKGTKLSWNMKRGSQSDNLRFWDGYSVVTGKRAETRVLVAGHHNGQGIHAPYQTKLPGPTETSWALLDSDT